MATKSQQYTGRLYTQAEVDRLVREARLDELKNCCEECGYWHIDGHNSRAMLFSERIAELKAQQEEV